MYSDIIDVENGQTLGKHSPSPLAESSILPLVSSASFAIPKPPTVTTGNKSKESFIFPAKFDIGENTFLDVDDLLRPVSPIPAVETPIVTQTEADDFEVEKVQLGFDYVVSLFKGGFEALTKDEAREKLDKSFGVISNTSLLHASVRSRASEIHATFH
ncbi:uncharacterized protein LOC112492123 [Ziziphus jujuba]|uniref:Uncharacterized protein LOC112492123 n=1 Tax=Ziziphus jujuba TaxID=326968 RepID=A0ABM4A8N6_ZIZJJ|nr:uncharacterized protein LOC112492123 [Ziziphus jujuba]